MIKGVGLLWERRWSEYLLTVRDRINSRCKPDESLLRGEDDSER